MEKQLKKMDEPVTSDKDLQLLVDYCKKTIATVGGDGHSEIVLYYDPKKDEYSLHTYEQYASNKETHYSFPASKEVYDKVMQKIDELKLDDYKDARGIGLCGGMYIVKYKRGDNYIRVTTDNLPSNGSNMLTSVGNLMYSYIHK